MIRALMIGAAMVSLSACHVGGKSEVREAGKESARNYQVATFDRIEVAGPYDVTVTTGGTQTVSATGGEKLLDETEVKVENGALVIGPKKHNGMRFSWGDGKAHFVISAATLKGAAVAGSGDIKVDKVAGDFQGELAGSGSVSVAAMNGGNLKVDIAGSGDFTAEGTAQAVEVSIAGSGNVALDKLAAKTGKVDIAGSGDVRANLSETADISMMGGGDVTITGGAKCTTSKMGGGDVTCS